MRQQDATIGNVPFGVANHGTSVQVGGGVTNTLTRTISVYGDVAWQQNVVNDGGFRGWSFNAGLRWIFGRAAARGGPGQSRARRGTGPQLSGILRLGSR
nr:autotransporter outer membrane beta-barrel domain-containing protein [uncultured Rhodopila sp.]